MPQSTPLAPTSAGLTKRKMWIFRLLLLGCIPLVFILLLELVLRLISFGYPTGFFLPSERDGQQVVVQNNRFGWRFFNAAIARMPVPLCLPRVKAPNTVRIVVFGESAAQGDPQPRFGISRMLQAMLELRYPGRHFEVINTGMTAIDSNVILPIVRDCAGLDADVWVIYMGNNEVVGPFGAGTVFGKQTPPLPLIRASLALKTTRTGQLIDALVGGFHKATPEKNEWGGMEMFLNQQVRAVDSRMSAVYDHFSRNLVDIIKTGRRAGAGVIVSTVPVNLRDCPPFGSEHQPGLTEADLKKWNQLYESGVEAQAADNNKAATEWFSKAGQIDNQFAELHYRQGLGALALGDTAEAQKQFVAARDLDTLRFRCDSRLNGLIRQTVADYGDQQVILADAERAFAEHSPNGLPGDEFFYEHVHPNFAGNYLLAGTLGPQLEHLLPATITAGGSTGEPWPTEADCARRLAWSDWDKQEALADILSRLTLPPFTGQLNHEAKINELKAALYKLVPATQSAGIQEAQNLYKDALVMAPDDAVLREQLSVLEQLSGDLEDSVSNAQQAVNLLPSSSEDWSQLGIALAEQHQYAEAATAFRKSFQLNPEEVWALKNLAQALNDLGQRDAAINEYRRAVAVNPRFGPAWLSLGQLYEKMGRQSEADDCYHKALVDRVNRPEELTTLARFCESRGWHEAAATNYVDAIKLNPTDVTLYIKAGQNFDAAGRRAEAEQFYAGAIGLSPDLMVAHFLYGLDLGSDGKTSETTRQFREAVRIMPDLAEARINLGIALENEGNYSEALDQFNKILEQNPTNALAQEHVQALHQRLSSKSSR